MQPKALADLKVIEVAGFISGPYCGKLLADLGAEVVKVEPPTGDRARRCGPFSQDEPHPERSGLFLYLNTNKLGVTLDVSTATGRELFKDLAATADVVIENFSPGWMEEHGLGYDELRSRNQGLIMTSITPFGQSGPYSHFQATDLISIHMGGLGYGIPGRVDDPYLPPLKTPGRQADLLAGMAGAVGTLHAVFAREQDGLGAHVDVSAQEAVAAMVFGNVANYESLGKLAPRLKADGGAATPVLIAPCTDGHICFVVMDDRLWQEWTKLMGDPEWARDKRFEDHASRLENWDMIETLVAPWSRQFTKDEVYRMAQARRIPVAPIYRVDEVVNSRQLVERGFFPEVPHPIAGPIRFPGAAYKFGETPWRVDRPAPLLGQHNDEVYCRQLGRPAELLVKLREAGII